MRAQTVSAFVAVLTFAVGSVAHAATCASLTGVALPDGIVTSAATVPQGSFAPPENATAQAKRANFKALAAFCRVQATLKPSPDSDIKVEVWLPADGWNGRLEAIGNGGYAGSIGYQNMLEAVRDGYAVVATDTGHDGGRATFALGHPEKVVDNGWRAVHEMTVHAKTIVAAFYGAGPKFSYWNGCSSGGKQGLKEAQRFPADFDGIIAGAPANNMIRLHAGSLWNAAAAHETPGSLIPAEKLPMVHKAALGACDALDGAPDGLIENPTQCTFDPARLLCRDGDGPDCLTAAQVKTAAKIYSGAVNPRTGERIFPGWERGSELGWGITAGPQPEQTPLDTFGIVVNQNPSWDWRTFDFDRDLARAEQVEAGVMVSTDPDLSAFFARGGKLLMYHGWSDPNIAPRNSINYYSSVVARVGADRSAASMALFMMPGVGHCTGGEGPSQFDKMDVITDWVEKGQTPRRITVRQEAEGKSSRSRPLCPYPMVAKYSGAGSLDDAASFACVAPDGETRREP